MTRERIINRIYQKTGTRLSQRQLDRYFHRFDIKPVGLRLRPRIYPADSANRILTGLGFPAQTNGLNGHKKKGSK
jgi:hypothetical protein